MVKVRGKLRIYEYESVKAGKKYFWKQAKIIVRGNYIDKIKQFDNQEIEILINPTSRIETKDNEKLKRVLEIVDQLFGLLDEATIKRMYKEKPKILDELLEIRKEVIS